MELKEVLDIFGYKMSENSLNNIESLVELRNSIPNDIKEFQELLQNKSFETVIKESRRFMKSYFELHKIRYLKEYKQIEKSNGEFEYLMTSIHNCDPYKLPIEKSENGENFYESKWFFSQNQYPEVYFKKIKIDENITEFTSSIITHEITHTQIDLREGVVDYYNNIEILPILLEIIHYMEKCSINNNQVRPILRRLQHLVLYIDELSSIIKENFSYYDKSLNTYIILYSTYIESILKALNLFGIYENSNKNIRKEMISYIQNIFKANQSVEDFLRYYDVTFENSVDVLHKRVKQIKF